jgi:hypothetical protein
MSKNNIRVVSLTSDTCNKLKAQAAVAMNGDGTCSLKAMSMSCFASELCASNRHSMMNLDSLMSHKYKFVAITGDDDKSVLSGLQAMHRRVDFVQSLCFKFLPRPGDRPKTSGVCTEYREQAE